MLDSDPDMYEASEWPETECMRRNCDSLRIHGVSTSRVSGGFKWMRSDCDNGHRDVIEECRQHPCGQTLDTIYWWRIESLGLKRRWSHLYEEILGCRRQHERLAARIEAFRQSESLRRRSQKRKRKQSAPR